MFDLMDVIYWKCQGEYSITSQFGDVTQCIVKIVTTLQRI
jgi:hypothetical protein